MNVVLLSSQEQTGTLPTRDGRARHIRRVLKAGPGDRVRAGIVGGPLGSMRLLTVDSGGIGYQFDPEPVPENAARGAGGELLGVPAPAPVDLLLGHPRPIVLRRMLRDLTTLGVRRILVTHTELGERSYYESNIWDSVESHLREGASQAGSTYLPEVVPVRSLSEAIVAAGAQARGRRTPAEPVTRVVLHPPYRTGDAVIPLTEIALGAAVTVAIGAERGWTEAEVALLCDAGFQPAHVGTRTLRTETAAVAAIAVLLGGWRFAQ